MTEGPGEGPGSPVRRYLLEGATIVAGILLALLLDAAWDWIGDRGEEAGYLTGLREELEASAVELAADQEAREVILARTGALLQHARLGTPVPPDSVAPWLEALIDFRFFTPVRTVMDDLVASGGMALIRSDEVRYSLLAYAQEMERLQVVEAREREFVADQVEPWLVRSVPLPGMIALEEGGSVDAPDPAGLEALQRALADPDFATLIQLRWRRTDIARRFASSVDRSLRRATRAVE